MSICKDKILQLMSFLEIDSFEGVKKIQKRKMSSMSIEELENLFNDKTTKDLLVVNVDLEKSLENLTIVKGYPEKIAKGVLDLLLSNYELKYDELEIMK